jgi:guanyl-specific ribonuclease Sa
LKYTDPTGEWFGIDDLIAALIGGSVNLVINIVQGNVHNFAQGASYFGVGAVGGVLTIYVGPAVGGAVMGAGNSLVTQGFGNDGNWNWSNVSGKQVLFDGLMGGLTGQIGSSLGGLISPYVNSLTSNIGGQAIQQGITQGVTGSATGFALGTGFVLMNGENFGYALKAGGQNALMGFAIGTASGMASGMRSAYKANENPWTGKSNIGITADDLGVSSTMNRIARGESYSHDNDGSTFQNKEGILPAKGSDYYKEYVHPTPGINGHGPQRVVTGSGGEYFYTPDHYKTFIRFKY